MKPVLDVELVPSADASGPVVDVAIVPVGTSRLARLATLAQVQAVRRAQRKDQLGTRLDRAIAHKAARLTDRHALIAWAFKVKTRDQWKDRKTGVRVLRTLTLDPLRAEAHHVVSRDDHAVRYDVRNGICLSFATHDAVERGRLRIEGTVFFSKGGARYIDTNFPVVFVRR